jgi:hypothetical protein
LLLKPDPERIHDWCVLETDVDNAFIAKTIVSSLKDPNNHLQSNLMIIGITSI